MVPVDASVDQVWKSAIEVFAERTHLIANLEKVSGLIASDFMTVNSTDGHNWADCGTDIVGDYFVATGGRFNFRVSEDTGTTRIKVTARWSSKAERGCISKGTFEDELETAVRVRAQAASR